jgi:hypothetical protein
MIEYLFTLPYLVLEVPNLKMKRPSWLQQPSAMLIFSLVLLSYFLVTGGNLPFFLSQHFSDFTTPLTKTLT